MVWPWMWANSKAPGSRCSSNQEDGSLAANWERRWPPRPGANSTAMGRKPGLGQEVEAAIHRFPGQGHQHETDLGIRLSQDLVIVIEALGRQGQKPVQFVGHHLGQVLGRGLGQGRRTQETQVPAHRQAHRAAFQPPLDHRILEPRRQGLGFALPLQPQDMLHLEAFEALFHLGQGQGGLVQINPQAVGAGQKGGGETLPQVAKVEA